MTKPRLKPLIAALILVLASAMAIAGCGAAGEREGIEATGDGPVDVVTTTNFITDAVREVGGDRVSVKGLMGAGVDPHLYKASAGDVNDLREADAIFYGGLYLEAKMQEVFEELSDSRPVFAVTDRIPRDRLLAPPSGAPEGEEYDPHVWFDVSLWKYAVEEIRDDLIEVDPAGEPEYRRNAARYLKQLDALDRETGRRLASIPASRRVLVTSHDAFRYLGRRYDLDVAAIQGLSTAAEATTDDIERVAKVVADRGVKSVFVESSVPPQTINAVLAAANREGGEASEGDELYSDAAGQDGTFEGTYRGMVESNIDKLVEGLR
ncbi:MAG TPA: zinc ABC transporter substrate-binding protein [Solirubrobacterales bacterium]|nr:zinc ABC transporter substrate-binding protein [Solirubrobacterales bacterium]